MTARPPPPAKLPDVFCGECGAPMIMRTTKKFTYNNGMPRNFWGCSRWPQCNGIHGAHPDGRPLGIPADKETKQWRMKAHEAFDRYWKLGSLTRPQSYKLLEKIMRMDKEEAHIGRFSIVQCQTLISCIESGAADLILAETA